MTDNKEWKSYIIEPDNSRVIIRDKDSFICEMTMRDDVTLNTRIIVTAVNSCKSINKDNPQLVAESIEEMYQTLKSILNEVDFNGDINEDYHSSVTINTTVEIAEALIEARFILNKLEEK